MGVILIIINVKPLWPMNISVGLKWEFWFILHVWSNITADCRNLNTCVCFIKCFMRRMYDLLFIIYSLSSKDKMRITPSQWALGWLRSIDSDHRFFLSSSSTMDRKDIVLDKKKVSTKKVLMTVLIVSASSFDDCWFWSRALIHVTWFSLWIFNKISPKQSDSISATCFCVFL